MSQVVIKGSLTKKKKAGDSWKKDLLKNWRLHVLLLPGIIFTIIFAYIPMGGIVIAFQDYKPWLGIFKSKWVGLEHFYAIFQFQESRQAIINTLIIATLKIIFGLIVPIIMALLLNEVRKIGIKRTMQTLVYLPHFLSWVTVAGMMIDILSLDGIVNKMLNSLGMHSVFFLGEPSLFRPVVVISDIWKSFGFGMIVYLATIAGIDPSYYEAAEMDGANRFKQTIYVTIPCMLPMIIVIATLQLGNVLNAGFDQIFNLYNPLVYSTGDIIDTYVYRASLLSGQYSFGTAVGLFKSAVSLILIVISYRLAYKYGDYKIF
ncbi:ABC transporter permease [Clostridium oryzae]|uniref:Putative multiple-sugar transport system permease YteP n=1 Tax=Clostridium oryzae TaxID=1450648 RepID=A0A1V4IMR1_9CLOT|nr:ABC transporter permease subunit [Clostridium oryzae]OPJ61186.1 putative multiple-sugar transport system permease YteP [Clostridium oryzae]